MSKSNPIFSYQASAELGEDAWGNLVRATVTVKSDELPAMFKVWEDEYKEATEMALPGSWRSAKSVIVNARKWNIFVSTPEGPRGKTAVEKDIKAAKGSTTKTPDERINEALKKLEAAVQQAGHSFSSSMSADGGIDITIRYS